LLRNYFTLAWRNLYKQKAHSFINIVALSVGMAVAMLIGLCINYNLSFNTFHKNNHDIAQVWGGGTDLQS
jgi:hypothetical protein